MSRPDCLKALLEAGADRNLASNHHALYHKRPIDVPCSNFKDRKEDKESVKAAIIALLRG